MIRIGPTSDNNPLPLTAPLAAEWTGDMFWWAAVVVFLVVVVPAVVLIANRIVSATRQIRLYVYDAAEHAERIDLGPLSEALRETGRLVGPAGARTGRNVRRGEG